ncbi:MAG: hypothetical protein J7M40_07525, partial [Planctomycetes bacterium]|nr:hypothetical protein [Planctomycetota bacterium]
MLITKRPWLFALALLIPAISCTMASAAMFVTETPLLTSIQDIIDAGGEISAGDKVFVFDENSVVPSGTAGALAPDASTIMVSAGYWDGGEFDGEIGLRFNSTWQAGYGQIADTVIMFRVSILEPERSQGYLIVDNTLYMDAFGVSG